MDEPKRTRGKARGRFRPTAGTDTIYDKYVTVPDAVWREIRDAVVAGVEYSMISTRTKVPESWISSKAEQEEWLTPARRDAIVAQYGMHRPEQLAQIKEDLALAAAAVSAERALEHRAFVATMASGKLKESAADLPAPRNWKDAEIADKMARRALGLEDGPSVQAVVQIGSLDASAVEDVIDV